MDGSPVRTCVGCRRRRLQSDLIRVSRRADGSVTIDERRAAGRGAYVCPDDRCVTEALQSGRLRRALRSEPVGSVLRDELLHVVTERS